MAFYRWGWRKKLLGAGLILGLAGLLVLQGGYPQDLVRQIVEHETSKILKQPVTVKRVSGNLLFSAHLHGVTIYNRPGFPPGQALHIARLDAFYNPFSALLHQGDFARASYSVYLRQPVLYVLRDSRDEWNVLQILPPPVPGAPPPTFHGKLHFDGLTIHIQDELGWGPTPNRFTQTISSLNGSINFLHLHRAPFQLTGQVLGNPHQTLQMSGLFNAENGHYVVTIKTQHFDLSTWGNYVFNRNGYHFSSGEAQMRAKLESKPVYVKGKIPFWYDISVTATGAKATLPFLTQAVQDGHGHITLKQWASTAALIHITDAKGTVGGIPAQAEAKIYPESGQVDAQVDAASPALSSLWQVLPGLSALDFTGGASEAKATITGSFSDLSIDGSLMTPQANFYGVPVQNLDVHFTRQGDLLSFHVNHGLVYAGAITGNGQVQFGTTSPTFQFKGLVAGMPISRLLSAQARNCTGSVDTQFSVQGMSQKFSIVGTAQGNQALFYGQRFSHALGGLRVVGTQKTATASIWINGGVSPLLLKGTLEGSEPALITLSGTRVAVMDPWFRGNPPGYFTGQADLRVPLSHPSFAQLGGRLEGKISTISVRGRPFGAVQFEVSKSGPIITIYHFLAHQGRESINLSGDLVDQHPTHLNIDVVNLDLDNPALVDRYIPEVLKPVAGDLSFHGQLSRAQGPSKALSPEWGWLSSVMITGNVVLSEGRIQNQPLDQLTLRGAWNRDHVDLDELSITQYRSTLRMYGQWSPKAWALTIPKSQVRLQDFPVWLSSFGKFEGETLLEGRLTKTAQHTDWKIQLDMDNAKTAFLSFDKVAGEVSYHDQTLSLSPLRLSRDKDVLTLKGDMDTSTLLVPTPKSQALSYHGVLSFEHVKLSTFWDHVEGFWQSIRAWNAARQAVQSTEQTQTATGAFNLSSAPGVLYSERATTTSALITYQTLAAREAHRQTLQSLGLKSVLDGVISGEISAISQPDRFPLVSGNVRIAEAQSFFVHADTLRLSAQTVGETMSLSLGLDNGHWGTKSFQEMSFKGDIDSTGLLTIRSSAFKGERGVNSEFITGSLPLNPQSNAPLDMRCVLRQDDLGLLCPISSVFRNITNDGDVILTMTGTLSAPALSAPKLELKNTKIYFNTELTSISSPFVVTTANVSFQDNVLTLSQLRMTWQGQDTLKLHSNIPFKNLLSLTGKVTILDLNFATPGRITLLTHLNLEDTALSVNFPKLYRGDVRLSDIRLLGEYSIPVLASDRLRDAQLLERDQETGPVLWGSLALANGEIVMPTLGTRPPKPSILLNLDMRLLQDITVVGSLLDQNVFNTFDLSMSPTPIPVQLLGTLNFPRPQSPLYFTEGNVHIFDRSFTLLSPDDQRIYFANQQYKVLPNRISFQVQEDTNSRRLHISPILEAAAVSVVDPDTPLPGETVEGEAARYRHIVVSINGPVYDLRSFVFQKFLSDGPDARLKSVTFVGSVSLGDSQSSDRLFEILMPDLHDSLARNNLNSQPARIIGKLSENQINSALNAQIRPVEKQIARNIGLYDIRVDYNLGGALLKATNIKGVGSEDRNVGVSFFQNLFSDQLFLRVKTNVDTRAQGSANNVQFSEFELTYYILRNLSASYASTREDTTSTLLDTQPISKWILKYRYEY